MLQLMPPGSSLPTGLVFACFMLAMTLGGMIFALVLPVFPGGCLSLTALVFAVSAAAMAVPIYCFEFWWVFISFLVLECMLGMFGSCGGTLRSIYYPEGMQSSIMSIFRLPLNLLVVVGTLLTNNANNVEELKQVYMVVAGIHFTAFLFQVCVVFFPIPCENQATATCGSPRKSSKKKD
jgi:MFS family permease